MCPIDYSNISSSRYTHPSVAGRLFLVCVSLHVSFKPVSGSKSIGHNMASQNGASLSQLEYLSDLVLVSAEGDKFSVHKVFLAKYSGFFRELFSPISTGPSTSADVGEKRRRLEMAQTGPDSHKVLEVKMDDISSEILETLIAHIYSSSGKPLVMHCYLIPGQVRF